MEHDIYKHIGQIVKKTRMEIGFTQEELAERANLHPSYIGQIERGVKKISLLTLYKLSKGLDIELYRFFKERKSKVYKAKEPDVNKKLINLIKNVKNNKRAAIYKIIKEILKIN